MLHLDKQVRKLFLDDYRIPLDCMQYMYTRIGSGQSIYLERDWDIVTNYPEFVKYILDYGVPDLISFDHDLADGHYHKNMQQGVLNYESEDFEKDEYKTGKHCAEWLCNYCLENKLTFPRYIVHSMNKVGTENIISYIENYIKHNE